MSGIEGAIFSKLVQEGMQKKVEQNILTQTQVAAQEGRIPNISEVNRGNMDVQESLANKLTDSREKQSLSPSEQRKKELADGYQSELRDVVAEGKIPEIDTKELHPCSPQENAAKRLDFQREKNSLIQEWGLENKSNWPRYTEDVFDVKTGKQIRCQGDYYDAHHVTPLELDGENKASNLAPIHAKDHYDHRGVHRSDSYLSQLRDYVKGV